MMDTKEIWIVFDTMGVLDRIYDNEFDAKRRVGNMKFSYSYQKYVAEGELQR